MAFKITVWTEDDSEYDLNASFNSRQEAHDELDDIIENGAYIGDSRIECGKVVKTDD